MSLSDRLKNAALALRGQFVYTPEPSTSTSLTDSVIERVRTALGGMLQPQAETQTRWYMSDLETAQKLADRGDMSMVAQLAQAFRRDGEIIGLSKVRSSGLLALPKKWAGAPDIIAALQDETGATTPIYERLVPSVELALFLIDTIHVGVGVGELIPVKGRDFPQFVRLDPQFLRYRLNEGRWYYQSRAGSIPITPGDGRWVLHTAGGAAAPWQAGLWYALGRAFIAKEHAWLNRGNYGATAANPARVAYSPQSSTQEERLDFLGQLVRWAQNSSFALPSGWEVKLLESNGRGWEVYEQEILTASREIMIALCGQIVTVTGGAGFANADIHATIASNLVKENAQGIALCVSTQILAPWALERFGEAALENPARFEFNCEPPANVKAEADAHQSVAKAVNDLCAELAKRGVAVNVRELVARYNIPLLDGAEEREAVAVEEETRAEELQPAAPSEPAAQTASDG